MNKLPILLVLVIFLLSACQTKTFTFNGTSDNWTAKIRVMQTGDMEEQNFVLKYEGDDLENVGSSEVKFKIEDNTGSSSGTGTLTTGGVLESKGNSNCSGCAFVTEDTEITFTVEWGGKSENILLKTEKD
jgi:hypothetical protein